MSKPTQGDRIEALEKAVTSLVAALSGSVVTTPAQPKEAEVSVAASTSGTIADLRSGIATSVKDFEGLFKAQGAKAKTRAKNAGRTMGLWWTYSPTKGRDYVLPYDYTKVRSMKNGVLLGTVSPTGEFKSEVKGLTL